MQLLTVGGKLTDWDVAKQAREINPEMPLVYMTGAGADRWPSHSVPNSVLVSKAFAPAQVVTAVSQLLTRRTHIYPLGKYARHAR
ncbi:putative nucleotidyltransferase [Bradyrhizobium sp. i1.15.2]|uniref:response regulator n=1 Tax=Bradyrhizobium sp. i1.15.2 TaxID=3156362 RepID=UPI00339541AA